MSGPIREISGRQLWLGLTKLIVILTVGLLLIAVAITILIENQFIKSIASTALLLSLALMLLTNGVLAACNVVDWFAARRDRADG